MRRRSALLLLPLVALVWFFRPRAPVDHALNVHFGARSAEVRQADLVFERGDTIVHDAKLYFASGAPRDLERNLRLAAGDYNVGVRLVLAGGEERHLARDFHVEGEEPIDLDLPVR